MSGESRAAAVGHLFQHEPDGTDVAAYAARKPSKLTQPFLLCLGPEVQPSQFWTTGVYQLGKILWQHSIAFSRHSMCLMSTIPHAFMPSFYFLPPSSTSVLEMP